MLAARENLGSLTESTRGMVVLVGILALTICLARVAIFRSTQPTLFGQGFMYKEIALSIASGHGYTQLHGGGWPGRPTILRAPLWPFVMSVPISVFPRWNPEMITQFLAGLMQATTAIGVGVLVGMLTGSPYRMVLGALMIALMPTAQPLLLGGFCEPLAAAILVTGTLLVCRGGRSFWGGAFVLSLLPLVRPNFVLIWAAVTALIWWLQSHGRGRFVSVDKRQLMAALVLLYIPSGLWVMRNYLVSGAFPVLTGTSSTTFYGNYNPISATIGPRFGRWIVSV
jgi:hypothetical protein